MELVIRRKRDGFERWPKYAVGTQLAWDGMEMAFLSRKMVRDELGCREAVMKAVTIEATGGSGDVSVAVGAVAIAVAVDGGSKVVLARSGQEIAVAVLQCDSPSIVSPRR